MRFYNQLRRQGQSVDRYEELLIETLYADSDRSPSGCCARRGSLPRRIAHTSSSWPRWRSLTNTCCGRTSCEQSAAEPLGRVVVAVGDWIADPHGLFAADFDLLSRLPGLEQLDIVATTALLHSGFAQRVHDWLPGLDEIEAAALGVTASPVPRMLAPEPARTECPCG